MHNYVHTDVCVHIMSCFTQTCVLALLPLCICGLLPSLKMRRASCTMSAEATQQGREEEAAGAAEPSRFSGGPQVMGQTLGFRSPAKVFGV